MNFQRGISRLNLRKIPHKRHKEDFRSGSEAGWMAVGWDTVFIFRMGKRLLSEIGRYVDRLGPRIFLVFFVMNFLSRQAMNPGV